MKLESCVMCGEGATFKAAENGEPLCERCYRNNLEARKTHLKGEKKK